MPILNTALQIAAEPFPKSSQQPQGRAVFQHLLTLNAPEMQIEKLVGTGGADTPGGSALPYMHARELLYQLRSP